jgi:peptide/nickel transport system substrate-binding protein
LPGRNDVKRFLRINRLALALAVIFISVSCTGKSEIPPNTLVIGVETGPRVLDPRYAMDAISSHVCALIYPGLMRRDKNLRLVPHIAESVEQPDKKTYDIKLKKGVMFHNGRELTSADVRYTIESILDPGSASPKKSAFSKIESIETPGRYRLIIRLSEVFAPFAGNLTQGIVPDGSKNLSGEPVGSGPFRYISYDRGSRLHLASFEGYFEGRPKIDGVILRLLPDETVRLLALKKGEIDLVSNGINPAVLPWLGKQKNIVITQATGTNASYIGFNMEDGILKNGEVRRAIAHAIDRKPIIKYLLKGLAVETESIIAPTSYYHDKNLQPLNYDPALAKKILDDAGYAAPGDGGPRFKLTYKTSKNPSRKNISEIIGEQLRQVGIEVEIKSFEWGTFFSDIKKGNFQMYSLTWVGIADPDIYHYIFHSESFPPHGANRGRYVNRQLDRLLEAGRTETDLNSRRGIYKKAQKIIADEKPYIHLWIAKNVAAMNRRVKGFEIYPDESLDSLVKVTLEEKS